MKRYTLLMTLLAAGGFLVFVQYVEPVHAGQDPLRLTINRQHSGKDCTSGQIALEGNIVGYTLERPWEGNIPLISSIPAGSYHGHVRTKTNDRWRIELDDVPGRSHIQLHVGNFIADGVGCVLIGSNLKSDLCTLTDGKAAFDKFKLAFAAAAAKKGQSDSDTPVDLTISDLSGSN